MSANGDDYSSDTTSDTDSVVSETPSELHDPLNILLGNDEENEIESFSSDEDESSSIDMKPAFSAASAEATGGGGEEELHMEDVSSLVDKSVGGGSNCLKSGNKDYLPGGNGNRFLFEDDDIITTNEKFDAVSTKKYVEQYHPECIYHNAVEIEKLCVRTDGDDPLHRTIPILSKYERARVLGKRAKQLNSGAASKGVYGEMDGYIIAVNELESRQLPFIIRRPLPNNTFEYWKLSDLENIHF
jgi:DNA-directed RNA polymerase subunit K/omega